MKKILITAASSILLMASCTQQNTPSPNNNNNNGGGNTNLSNIDSSYFFKISFQNKNLYNYAVKVQNVITYNYGSISTSTTNGVVSSSFYCMLYNLNSVFPNSSTCSGNLFLQKLGNGTGIYNKINQTFQGYYITDNITSKQYFLDSNCNFNVTAIGLNNITGTFTCKLIDGTTLIPASGSFNLYKP
jgi:hypothetical protein